MRWFLLTPLLFAATPLSSTANAQLWSPYYEDERAAAWPISASSTAKAKASSSSKRTHDSEYPPTYYKSAPEDKGRAYSSRPSSAEGNSRSFYYSPEDASAPPRRSAPQWTPDGWEPAPVHRYYWTPDGWASAW